VLCKLSIKPIPHYSIGQIKWLICSACKIARYPATEEDPGPFSQTKSLSLVVMKITTFFYSAKVPKFAWHETQKGEKDCVQIAKQKKWG